MLNTNVNTNLFPLPFGYSADELHMPLGWNEEKQRVEFNDPGYFTGINYITEAATHFKKYGVYTKAHPVYDKKEYQDFWDEEEKRRRNGVVLPGGVVVKTPNGWVTKKIWIPGEFYGYLNYAQIQTTTDSDVFKDMNGFKRNVSQKTVTFPSFWDWDYMYFHSRHLARQLGKHMTVGKARRKGYSYKNGWCAANRYDLIPGRATVIGAHLLKYIAKGSGMMVMAKNYIDFINTHTDWAKKRLINNTEHVKSGYKLLGQSEEHGFKSEIFALSFDQTADSAIGKDADEVYLDEAGAFPNLHEVVEVTLPLMEDGDITTGMMTIFGTGGTKGANWQAFESMFYQPALYNMLPFENIFDENSTETNCAFFHPYQKNLVPYIDENGNSLESAALLASKLAFEDRKNKKVDPEKLLLWRGQRAESPSQAFTKSTSNYFYSPELAAHYETIKHKKNLAAANRYGLFENNVFYETDKHPPIDTYPAKVTDYTGVYVEFNSLYRDPVTKQVPPGLYKVWHDPFDVDKDENKISIRDSLGVAFVYEQLNNFTPSRGDVLMGVYVGRPGITDNYNSQLFQLIEWCNGKMLFENDRGQVIPYAKRIKATHRLMEEPSLLWTTELKGGGSRSYGISMGDDKRKLKAAQLFRDWLYTVRGRDANNAIIYNFHTIKDPGTLEEILAWNLKGNFDRMSALFVGMFDIQETLFIPVERHTEAQDDEDEFLLNRNLFQ